MSDEAAREEAYLNKIMNPGRGAAAKKGFGGGLEAARAKQQKPAPVLTGGLEAARNQAGMGPKTTTQQPPRSTYNPYNTPLETEVVELDLPPPHVISHHPPPPKPKPTFVPPPLETEVVELSLPLPGKTNDVGLVTDEDAARREEERMAKSIGKFYIAPKPGQPAPVPSGHSGYSGHTGPTGYSGNTGPSYSGHSAAPAYTAPKSTAAGGSRQRKDWELPPKSAQYNTKFENFLFAEITLARNSPDTILDRLRDRRNHYVGNQYTDPELGTLMDTIEGLTAVDDAIRYLERIQGNRNKLKLEEGLSMSARDFCELSRDNTAPQEAPEEAHNRLTRYGQYYGSLSQNVAFSNVPPSGLILDWIIDDGQAQAGRPHRNAIFDPQLSVIGVASGPHVVGRVICVLFANSYRVHDGHTSAPSSTVEEVSLPMPGAYGGGAPSGHGAHGGGHGGGHGGYGGGVPAGHVYPDFQIGGLIAVENNTANILPITSLGCELHELSIGIRQNGNAIEFRRNVTQAEGLRTEVQNLNLPYQVTPQTTSAVYFRNRNNGELELRLGKQLAGVDGGLSLEFEIARFTIPGQPGSSNTRVQFGVNQMPDHYIFSPGPSSQYQTDFIVVLNGNALEFRSTHSFHEGDSVKTVNGKQTVNLPAPPSFDQIDVDGSTITVWPNRKKGGGPEKIIPDCEVQIRLG